jgi:hypothetical protein
VDTATTAPHHAHGTRRLLPAMRALLIAFSLLTALAVVALYVLAGHTDRFFAWTVQPALTAAFLGAGYAAGFLLVVLSLRDPVWANSRVAVVTILVFVGLTLAATLLHIDRFHFRAEFAGLPWIARAAAWFWLAVYLVVPVAMLGALATQERAPGTDPTPRDPVPLLLRCALAGESVVLLGVGVALYVAPATATTLWPWPLTPLTARVVAAWLIAFGAAAALAAAVGDLRRLRTAAIAYTAFGVLVAAAVARFPGTVAWGSPRAWLFTAVVAAVVVTGAVGWLRSPAPERPAPAAGVRS